jgi:F0F1-type ATP synthase membrane subunit a
MLVLTFSCFSGKEASQNPQHYSVKEMMVQNHDRPFQSSLTNTKRFSVPFLRTLLTYAVSMKLLPFFSLLGLTDDAVAVVTARAFRDCEPATALGHNLVRVAGKLLLRLHIIEV